MAPDEDGVCLTWSFACLSASELPELPEAPADALIALATWDALVTETEPPDALRSRVAPVVGRTTATPIAAPTATLSPPALASAFVTRSEVKLASRTIAPVTVSGVPLVPRRAVVVVGAIVSATAGLTETPPAEPALVSVMTVSLAVARIVTSLPPVRTTPSSTSARVRLVSRMFSATEAPTPTLPASDCLAPACAMSTRLAWATIETSPVPAATDAPVGTVARVSTSGRFSANEPATPMLDLPAPDSAWAANSCSTRRKSWSAVGEVGSAVPVVIAVTWRFQSPPKPRISPSRL